MVPRTRRAVLSGAGALLAGLAGCGRNADDGRPDDEPTEPVSGSATDPDHVALRRPDHEAAILRRPDENATDDVLHTPVHGFVASEADSEAVRVDDGEGAAAARRLLAETDYGAETVFFEHGRVHACYRRELCSVSWTARSVETDWADVLRPADYACGADETEAHLALIRIPAALDPDEVRTFGSSHSSGRGGCRIDREDGRGSA